MKYRNVTEGIFIRRPNRFIAEVELDGTVQQVHVKNTGRLPALLQNGRKVYLQRSEKEGRKTAYDLISVEKDERVINVDSQIPNAAAEEWIRQGGLFTDLRLLKREVTYGDSRFDLYAEYGDGQSSPVGGNSRDLPLKKAFIEVKGVTSETEGIARFPDAPTQRGIKHLRELVKCLEEGYEAYILFVIQMKEVKVFEADSLIHPEFAEELRKAAAAGVHVMAFDCEVEPDSILVRRPVRVCLDQEG